MHIRIISTPPGFAREHIRREWVGLTLPLVPEDEVIAVAKELRTPIPEGYVVRGFDAVTELLGAGKAEAAAFWSRPICPNYLEFAREVCEEIA